MFQVSKDKDHSTVNSSITKVKNRTILHGDVLEKLKEIPDESIDCVITSPPYWGLRDYGVDGQMGLEPDFFDYLSKLREIMRELKRIMKITGTCWVNIADTYFQKKTGSEPAAGLHGEECDCATCKARGKVKIINPIKRVEYNSKCGIPSRFLVQCLDDGWICRNDIIWYKPNSMPDSVRSKFPACYEPIFFLVKSNEYYCDTSKIEVKSKTKIFETKRQKDVFEIPIKRFEGFHMATFPEELPLKIMSVCTKFGDLVLDPFFGSGTVGECAEKMGLRWIGIELNQDYIDFAKKRLYPYMNERLQN